MRVTHKNKHTCEDMCQDKLQARINDRRNNVSWKSQLKYESGDKVKEEEEYNRRIDTVYKLTHNLDKREKMMKGKWREKRKIYTKDHKNLWH